MPRGVVHCSFLLRSAGSIYWLSTLSFKKKKGKPPDEIQIMAVNTTVSFDDHLVNFFFPLKRQLSCFCCALGDCRGNHQSMQTYTIIPSCTGNRVTRSFHRINMTGLFKRKEHSLRLHVRLISAVRPSRLRLGCPTSSHQAALWEASGDCTLSKALYGFKVLAWHSPRRSLKVCATCSRWMIWHLKEMPTRKKVGTSRFSEFVCAHVCFGTCNFFAFCSGHLVKFCPFLESLWPPVGPWHEPRQSEEPIRNAVIWLDRNRTADRVQRLHSVSGTQTDHGMDSLCEAPAVPVFTLSDGPFRQPSHEQSSHSKECLTVWNKNFSKCVPAVLISCSIALGFINDNNNLPNINISQLVEETATSTFG